jgi:flagellar motor switch protein FliN/FliY
MKKDTNLEATSPQMIALPAMIPAETTGVSILSGSLDAVYSVKTRITVVAGHATASIGELMEMRADQVLKLESLADEPVDIVLEGSVVARGQLVAVDDNFGVRIVEITKAGKA